MQRFGLYMPGRERSRILQRIVQERQRPRALPLWARWMWSSPLTRGTKNKNARNDERFVFLSHQFLPAETATASISRSLVPQQPPRIESSNSKAHTHASRANCAGGVASTRSNDRAARLRVAMRWL